MPIFHIKTKKLISKSDLLICSIKFLQFLSENMQHSWILDLVIKDATINNKITDLKTPIWFVVLADGMQQPFSTNQVQFSRTPSWNYPARLVLHFLDISRAYLYVTLCTFGNNEILPLARSRVSLRNLPIGSPKVFKFPLLTPQNDEEAVSFRCVGTLSSFTPQIYIPPAQQRGIPQMGGQPMGMSPAYMTNQGYGQPGYY